MTSLLGNKEKGLIFIVSAPAGTGKTTLVQKLVSEFPSIAASISYTTRKPREGERHGVHYFFIDEEEFKNKILAGEFLEYVQLHGVFYGTSGQWMEDQLNKGKHVVLVIDTQGASKVRGQCQAISIFIHPPNLETSRSRLILRKTEKIEEIEKRVEWAESELAVAKQFDYQFINDDLEVAYQIFKSIFIAECHRTRNI